MGQLRCAYFGCMTPLFTPTHGKQIYCSEECQVKANNRSKKNREWHKKNYESLTPEQKKQRGYAAAKSNFKSGKAFKGWD